MFVTRTLFAAAVVLAFAAPAEAQVVYYQTLRPLVAAPVVAAPAYVANYTPAGNYAAVTAFSPPVTVAPAAVAVTANYAPAIAPVAVTSFYAPPVAPMVVNYAPAPTVALSPVVAPVPPVVAAPVTAFYAPAVVTPLYRRGPFGGLRPVRTAYYIPY